MKLSTRIVLSIGNLEPIKFGFVCKGATIALALSALFIIILWLVTSLKRLRNFRGWAIRHLIRVTGLGLLVTSVIYLGSLVAQFHPRSLPVLLMIIVVGYPIASFFDVVIRLSLLHKKGSRGIPNIAGRYILEALPLTTDKLRQVKGRFRLDGRSRAFAGCLALLFGLVLPAFLVFAAYKSASYDANAIGCLVVAVGSIGLGIFLAMAMNASWDFTGDEIIAKYGQKIRWRVPIAAITSAQIQEDLRKSHWLVVDEDKRQYSVLLVPGLMDQIQRLSEE